MERFCSEIFSFLISKSKYVLQEQIVNYFWKIAKAGSLSQQENVQTSAFLQLKL